MNLSVDTPEKSRPSNWTPTDPSSSNTTPPLSTSASANPNHSHQLDPDAWVRAAKPGDENHHLWLERFGSLHSTHPRRVKSNLGGRDSSSSTTRPSASSIFNNSPTSTSRARSGSVGGLVSSKAPNSSSVGFDQKEVRRRASAADSSKSTNSRGRGGGFSHARGNPLPAGLVSKDGSERESDNEDYGIVRDSEESKVLGGRVNPASTQDPASQAADAANPEPSEQLMSPEELEKKKARRAARREKRKLKGKGREAPMPVLPPRNSSTITSLPNSTSNAMFDPHTVPPTSPTGSSKQQDKEHSSLAHSEFPPTPTLSNFSHSHSNSNSHSFSTSGHAGLKVAGGGDGGSNHTSAVSSASHARASSNGSIPIKNSTAFPSSAQSFNSASDLIPKSVQPQSPPPVNSTLSRAAPQLQNLDSSSPSRKSMSASRHHNPTATPSRISARTSSIVSGTAPAAESLVPKINSGDGDVPPLPVNDFPVNSAGNSVKRSLDLVFSKARFGLGGNYKDKEKEKVRTSDGSSPEKPRTRDDLVPAEGDDIRSEGERIDNLSEQGQEEIPVKPSRPIPATPPTSSSSHEVQQQSATAAMPSIYTISPLASRAPTVSGGRPLSRVWDASETEEANHYFKSDSRSGWRSIRRHSANEMAGEDTEDGDEFYDAQSDEGDEGEWSEEGKNGAEPSVAAASRTKKESSGRSGRDTLRKRSRRAGSKIPDREKKILNGTETDGSQAQSNATSQHSHIKASAPHYSRSDIGVDPLGSPNEEIPAWDQREKSDPLRAERELIARARAMRRAQRQSVAEEKALAAAAEVASQGSSKQLQAAEQAYIEYMLGEAEAERLAMGGIDPDQLTEQEREEARMAEAEVLRLFGGSEEFDLKVAEERQMMSPLAQEVIESQDSKPSQNFSSQSLSKQFERPAVNPGGLSPLVQGIASPSSNLDPQSSSPMSASTDQERKRNFMEQNTYFIPSVKTKGSVKSLASISAHSHSNHGGSIRPGSRGRDATDSSSQANSRSNASNRSSPVTPRSKMMMAGLLRKMKNSPAIMKLSNNQETSHFEEPASVRDESEQEPTPRKSSTFGDSWPQKNPDYDGKNSGVFGGTGRNASHQIDPQEEEEEAQSRSSISGLWRARVQSLSSNKSGKSEASNRRGFSSSTPPPPTPPLPAARHLPSALPPRPSTAGNDDSGISNTSHDSSWRWNLLNDAVGLSLGGVGRNGQASPASSPSSKEAVEKIQRRRKQRRHGEIEVPLAIAATPSVSEQQNVTIRKTLSPRILTDETHEADTLVEEVGSGSEAEEELKDLGDQGQDDSIVLRQHGEPIGAIDEAEELTPDGASSVGASRRGSESGYESNQGSLNQYAPTASRGKSPAVTVSRPSTDRDAKVSLSPKSSSSFADFHIRGSEDRRAPAPAALNLSPADESRGKFEDDSTNSPFLGGDDDGSRSATNPPSNHRNNIVPAFFLKSPASEMRRSFSTDRSLDRSPVSNRPLPPPGASPKVTSGLFGALKSGMRISSSPSAKHFPHGLPSSVSSGSFNSQNLNSQKTHNGGLEAVEEATRLLQSHTDAMTPSPMPSPMPSSASFSEHFGPSGHSSNSQSGPIGLGLGSAWEAQTPSGLPASSSASSLAAGAGGRVRQVSNSGSIPKTPQTPELRAFDDMLRGFGKADKALLKDIAARSKDSPLQSQTPVMRS